MSLADETYLNFTTYKKDGGSSAVPIWVVDAGDGKLAFTTSSRSLKVRRLANDPSCLLQPCDARGNVREGTEPVRATASVHLDAEFERVRRLVKRKYGVQFGLISLYGRIQALRGKDTGTDAAVIMTLED